MWLFIKKTFTFVTLAIALIGVSILMSFISKKGKDLGEPRGEPLKCTLATSGEALYHVAIQVGPGDAWLDGSCHCSGTLIHKQYVIAVGYCAFSTITGYVYNETRMTVFVGTRTRPGGTSYDVKKITCHPSFDYKTAKDAIAVIQLKKEVSTADYASPIPLPDIGITPYKGLKLIASGYKYTTRVKEIPYRSDQHIVSMQVISNKACQIFGKRMNLSGKFCASVDPGYSSLPCLIGKDIGSPATVNEKYVIGIAMECYYLGYYVTTKKESLVLFIDVSSYITFIKSAIA